MDKPSNAIKIDVFPDPLRNEYFCQYRIIVILPRYPYVGPIIKLMALRLNIRSPSTRSRKTRLEGVANPISSSSSSDQENEASLNPISSLDWRSAAGFAACIESIFSPRKESSNSLLCKNSLSRSRETLPVIQHGEKGPGNFVAGQAPCNIVTDCCIKRNSCCLSVENTAILENTIDAVVRFSHSYWVLRDSGTLTSQFLLHYNRVQAIGWNDCYSWENETNKLISRRLSKFRRTHPIMAETQLRYFIFQINFNSSSRFPLSRSDILFSQPKSFTIRIMLMVSETACTLASVW